MYYIRTYYLYYYLYSICRYIISYIYLFIGTWHTVHTTYLFTWYMHKYMHKLYINVSIKKSPRFIYRSHATEFHWKINKKERKLLLFFGEIFVQQISDYYNGKKLYTHIQSPRKCQSINMITLLHTQNTLFTQEKSDLW